jgi:hypothetical protein
VGFFRLAGCSLESYVSRYDGEIGGGKEEKRTDTRGQRKKPAENWAGRKGVTSCPFPSWRAERVGEELPGTSKQQW